MKKRIISLLLVLVMVLGMLPVSAFATEVQMPTEPCAAEGCTYGANHEGNCSNYAGPSADELAAQAVIVLIDAIGEVSLESEAAITAANDAYNALTDEQKALVTNADVLEAAKSAFSVLTTAVVPISGDGVVYANGADGNSSWPHPQAYVNTITLSGAVVQYQAKWPQSADGASLPVAAYCWVCPVLQLLHPFWYDGAAAEFCGQ